MWTPVMNPTSLVMMMMKPRVLTTSQDWKRKDRCGNSLRFPWHGRGAGIAAAFAPGVKMEKLKKNKKTIVK